MLTLLALLLTAGPATDLPELEREDARKAMAEFRKDVGEAVGELREELEEARAEALDDAQLREANRIDFLLRTLGPLGFDLPCPRLCCRERDDRHNDRPDGRFDR